ncbi:MAG: oxygen-independent coproporphyrinogen III oxidase, partial [Deltaproteobacteria bacterium]
MAGLRAISAQDPRRIPDELKRKYDVRGPRYTSYPPANHFGPVDEDLLFERWRERNSLKDDPGLSLYVHLPFCRKRCLFCGCHTFVAKRSDQIAGYVGKVIDEMRLAAKIVDPARPVRQIALGGGTPNALEAEQLDGLLSAMHDVWSVEDAAEKSVEINPRTATPEKLEVLLKHGFNRFSLGIQDFNPNVLKAVNRDQGLMEVEQVVAWLRERGVELLNFDLIYGLPGQSLESCVQTARHVIELRPTRIALYSYAHVPWIHPHQRALERLGLPEAEKKAELFLSMMDAFLEAGYLPIGMDHFALPEDSLAKALERGTLRRNFMGYTTGRGLDLLAFGASGISSIGTSYAQNHKGLDDYSADVSAGRLP